MLEMYLEQAEEKTNFFMIFFITLMITFIFAIVNSYLGKYSLFLVGLVSLALAYPVIHYIRKMNKSEIEEQMSSKILFSRHAKEMIVFWGIFLGITAGFLISIKLGFVTDFTYQEKFYENVSGMITNSSGNFMTILINNLEVNMFTFIISFLTFSGLIFVLSWNASILAYYIYNQENFAVSFINFLMLLPHGLLEIGGYIFAGIAGSILAYKLDRRNKFNHSLNKEFAKDLFILISISILLVFIGAGLEVL